MLMMGEVKRQLEERRKEMDRLEGVEYASIVTNCVSDICRYDVSLRRFC